ncbi:hypothetical protein GCM10010193_43060 [Kitasatospora atroaurantiaca]|uniref:LPXTG-motif cell wall-anchored protein n=1 Tax=Kitasatospora atroaurantiaca TaxID=285545 RepID=A0A561ETT3_9ACTN|nr:hypothetical protein [Kitasatospora atroaurantiaca]TWE19024.1 hypothetical protein FB465_4126 [Kitasatospora atroaurantiaca]
MQTRVASLVLSGLTSFALVWGAASTAQAATFPDRSAASDAVEVEGGPWLDSLLQLAMEGAQPADTTLSTDPTRAGVRSDAEEGDEASADSEEADSTEAEDSDVAEEPEAGESAQLKGGIAEDCPPPGHGEHGEHGQKPPSHGEHGQKPPSHGEHGQKPPSHGEHGQKPPSHGEHGQKPPSHGEHGQKPPSHGEHGQKPPSHEEKPPSHGEHGQKPPSHGEHGQKPPSHEEKPPSHGEHGQKPPQHGEHGQKPGPGHGQGQNQGQNQGQGQAQGQAQAQDQAQDQDQNQNQAQGQLQNVVVTVVQENKQDVQNVNNVHATSVAKASSKQQQGKGSKPPQHGGKGHGNNHAAPHAHKGELAHTGADEIALMLGAAALVGTGGAMLRFRRSRHS